MARGPTSTANIMQEQTGVPSSQTVQAEHAPRLQAIFVPVRPSGPRKTSASVARDSTFIVRSTPFTWRTASWMKLLDGSAASAAEAFGMSVVAPTPNVTQADALNSSRRDNSDPAMTILLFPLLATTYGMIMPVAPRRD